jgi:hypothetical protein
MISLPTETAGWITTETTDIRVELRVVQAGQAHA